MTSVTFWTHTVWFILLGITTLIELVIIFTKVTNRKAVFAFYLTLCGLAFSFEMIILSVLKAYQYYPMIIPSSPPDDSIAGNLFSQASIPATALLIAVLNLRYYWYFIFAIAYVVIEELFLVLGVYEQNWYQSWMTLLLTMLFFWITKHAYRLCFRRLKGFMFYLFIFLGLVALHQNLTVWGLRLSGVQLFSDSLLADKQHSLVVLSSSYMLLLGVIIMLLFFVGIHWGRKLTVILLLYIGHGVAMMFDLIIYKEGWFWISTSISIWSMYLFTFLLDQFYASRTRG